jgi:RloB-like protein
MGKDRSSKDLRRKKPKRLPIPRVLIVSEGSESEPNYFNEIRKEKRIPVDYIRAIHSNEGTQPLKVIDGALVEFKKKQKEYDHIFVVFDCDDHPDFLNAINKANAMSHSFNNASGEKVSFVPIYSVPCFELWILLHNELVHTVMHRDEALRRVKRLIPDYQKNMTNLYATTKAKLSAASANAAYLRERCAYPSLTEARTEIDILVQFLLKLPE